MILKDAENAMLSTKGKEDEGSVLTHMSTAAYNNILTNDAVISNDARIPALE